MDGYFDYQWDMVTILQLHYFRMIVISSHYEKWVSYNWLALGIECGRGTKMGTTGSNIWWKIGFEGRKVIAEPLCTSNEKYPNTYTETTDLDCIRIKPGWGTLIYIIISVPWTIPSKKGLKVSSLMCMWYFFSGEDKEGVRKEGRQVTKFGKPIEEGSQEERRECIKSWFSFLNQE